MINTLQISLDRPISVVSMAPDHDINIANAGVAEEDNVPPKAPAEDVSQVFRTIEGVAKKMNKFCEELFAKESQAIARLAVEIARKILAEEIAEERYDIEKIVAEALKSSPTSKDIVVYLNPKDFEQLENAEDGKLPGVKFLADENIGRAECMIKSPAGIMETSIDEQLEIITNALVKA